MRIAGLIFSRTRPCWSCHGTGIRWLSFNGRAVRETCPVCNGTGTVRKSTAPGADAAVRQRPAKSSGIR